MAMLPSPGPSALAGTDPSRMASGRLIPGSRGVSFGGSPAEAAPRGISRQRLVRPSREQAFEVMGMSLLSIGDGGTNRIPENPARIGRVDGPDSRGQLANGEDQTA